MEPKFMQSYNYMTAYVYRSWPYVVTRSQKSRRAIVLALLLISRPTEERHELVAHASHADIARVAGISERVVKQAIPELVDAELIEVMPGVGAASFYTLV